MELGEAVAVSMFIDKDDECPFTHEKPEKQYITQDLIGNGQTLARRLRTSKPTFKYDQSPGYTKEPGFKDPRETSWHPFFKDNQPAIKISFASPTPGGELIEAAYPASCAAHHLIPAQESLKRSDLTNYMIAKSDAGKGGMVKTGKKESDKGGGRCWSNIGYDVNGSQNGVFLPAGSAVHDGTWVPIHDEDDDYPAKTPAPPSQPLLTGGVVCNARLSRKWAYVERAVELCASHARRAYGGQFHDRHEPYSDFVLEVLQALHAEYVLLEQHSIGDSKCSKCNDIKKQIEEWGVPTPFKLVARLNVVSKRLETRLRGITMHPGLYTSDWGRAMILSLSTH